MNFLTEDDILLSIKQEFYTNVVAGLGPTQIDQLEAEAIEHLKSFLRHRYDVDTMFDQTGEDRHPLLLRHLKAVFLYDIHRRQNNRAIPDDVAADYEETNKWLRSVSKGEISPGFDKLPDDAQGSNDVRWTSETRREHGY